MNQLYIYFMENCSSQIKYPGNYEVDILVLCVLIWIWKLVHLFVHVFLNLLILQTFKLSAFRKAGCKNTSIL